MYLNERSVHVRTPRDTRSERHAPAATPGAGANPGRGFNLGRRAGFWVVAVSTSVLTAFSTAPSPLYGVYQRQDGLSSITITAVYSVYAVGIVASLLVVGHVSDWYGRRVVLVPALLTGLAAALVFSVSTSLPALFVGRVLTGLALGAAIATATAYLTDLDPGSGGSPTRRSQIAGTVANVGGLAVGPLAVGLLARYVPGVPRLPYEIFAVLLAGAVLATWAAPEGRPVPQIHPRYHLQRLEAPADARASFSAALIGSFMVFTVFGVFAGLAGAFLAGPLQQPSPVWAGLAVFVAFGSGVLTQVLTQTWVLRRLLALGVPAMMAGLTAVVASAWLTPPSLVLFLVGAAVVGIGSGSIYRGTLTLVLTTADGTHRAGALASFFVAGYVGLSLPVVGAGVALQLLSFQVTLLALSLGVAVGILLTARVLLRVPPTTARAGEPASRVAR
jgi:MFS family permease